jgi:hypothetical protein
LSIEYYNMINTKIACLLIILHSLFSFSQQKFTISGIITDTANNESINGVNITIPTLKTSVKTNEYGFYSITLPQGKYQIEVSCQEYETQTQSIDLNANTKINITLNSKENVLKEILITSKTTASNTSTPEMSVNKLSITQIKKVPVVFGEVDILKTITLLPGVTNGGEGMGGFNVRGGAADQNLVLLDESTLFNTSHVFGFFSVFNGDAIKGLTLYKGGIPTRFGGRASSVLDVQQRDGNSKEIHAIGGIGLISSRLLVEGPIVKEKGSFLVAGRGSYAHLFLKLDPEKKDFGAFFYDLNTKLNYKIDINNSVYMSGYFGRDVIDFAELLHMSYGNSILNARWNHLFNDKLFSNLSVIYSDYKYNLKILNNMFWMSNVKNCIIKYDFKNYLSDAFKLNYGINSIYYDFNPGKVTDENMVKQLDKKYALEPSVYIEAEHKISNSISINYGFRYSQFYRLGSSFVNVYKDNNALDYDSEQDLYEPATPIGKIQYSKNEIIKNYNYLEPRLAAAYSFNDNESIKASYNRMTQYIQFLSDASGLSPINIWTPSDSFIKPQIADQVAFGYFKNIHNNDYSLESEIFYKKIKNRLDYIDGANLVANEAIEQVILNGQMKSYGLELMFRKNTGKLTGWISYTLSKSQQQTPGRTPQETGINNGEWYNSLYDKRHNLAITSSYELNKKWLFSSNYIIQSGQATTYPESQYKYQDNTYVNYAARNANRLPTYHHLDISATLTPKKNSDRAWKGEWVFSIYNLFAIRNTAALAYRNEKDTGLNEVTKISIFGRVPAITYNFKF